jgi:hypothetical protein
VQTLRANIRLSPITIISGTLYETTLGKWIVEMIKHFTQLLGSDRLWSRICGISFCSVWVRIIKIWKFYGHLVSFLCPLNLLLNHWLPNIFGTSKWSKELELCGQSLLHGKKSIDLSTVFVFWIFMHLLYYWKYIDHTHKKKSFKNIIHFIYFENIDHANFKYLVFLTIAP